MCVSVYRYYEDNGGDFEDDDDDEFDDESQLKRCLSEVCSNIRFVFVFCSKSSHFRSVLAGTERTR